MTRMPNFLSRSPRNVADSGRKGRHGRGLHLLGNFSYGRDDGSDDGTTNAIALFDAHRGPNRLEVV